MTTRKYFAAINKRGFSNTWNVGAFDNRDDRDAYVEKWDGALNSNCNLIVCRAIKKSDIKDYVDAPKPFSGERRMIVEQWDWHEDEDDPGMIGYVEVAGPYDRLTTPL